MKYQYNYIYLIIIFMLIIFLFFMINRMTNITENYTGLKTHYFFDNLKKYNFTYDNQKNITYCPNNNKSIQCLTKNYKLHFNSPESVKLVKNKVKTSSLLQKYGIPVPTFVVVNVRKPYPLLMKQLQENKIRIPFVIKPINGTFGIDVQKIDSQNEFFQTLTKFKKKYEDMMVENFFEGSVYRIFVFQGKIIDIIKRDKPYIVGNGYDSVEYLITQRNQNMVNNGFFETKNLSIDYMEKQGYTLQSILPLHHKLFITNVINMHNGALLERINISSVPVKNLDLFIKVGQILKINCYGLDYISRDVTKPFKFGEDVILEVNGTPDTEIHTKIDEYGPLFFEKIVKNIF